MGYFVKREQEEMRGGSNGVKWREVEDAGNRADEEAALCVPSLMPNLTHEGAVMRIGNRTRFIVLTCLIKQLSGCFERGVCQDVTRWGPSVFCWFVSLKQHQQPQHPPPPPPKQKMHVSILDVDTQKTLTRLVPRQQPRTSCGGKTEWLVRDYAQINRSTVTLHHIWAVCEPKSGRCTVICETCSMCRTRPQNRPCDRDSRLCHQAVFGVYFLWIHLAI